MPNLLIRRFEWFQSTHSLRSATASAGCCVGGVKFQSTHSLRSATASAGCCVGGVKFQSTHSLRSATNGRATSPLTLTGFNPRTPCGVRPCSSDVLGGYLKFQSTHSLRSATRMNEDVNTYVSVSIHALLAECDPDLAPAGQKRRGFNPRTPCGVRPRHSSCVAASRRFQSTHSLRSATAASTTARRQIRRFQSTHSLRSATQI